MELGWEPEHWLQWLVLQPPLLPGVLLILVSCAWVMEIGVGMRWKRSPNHRRPQTMTMHPCPAVNAGGSQGLVSVTSGHLAGACERRLGCHGGHGRCLSIGRGALLEGGPPAGCCCSLVTLLGV